MEAHGNLWGPHADSFGMDTFGMPALISWCHGCPGAFGIFGILDILGDLVSLVLLVSLAWSPRSEAMWVQGQYQGRPRARSHAGPGPEPPVSTQGQNNCWPRPMGAGLGAKGGGPPKVSDPDL